MDLIVTMKIEKLLHCMHNYCNRRTATATDFIIHWRSNSMTDFYTESIIVMIFTQNESVFVKTWPVADHFIL